MEGRGPSALAMVGFPFGHEHQSLRHKLHQNMSTDAPLDHGSCAVDNEANPRWKEMLSSQLQDSMTSSRDRKTVNNDLRLHLQVPAERKYHLASATSKSTMPPAAETEHIARQSRKLQTHVRK
eukprot:TRINITY_DN12560_c0_g1_i10.p1 TRINITY_DN12560_c0_g1~~TRINITY_DN12560_c0_g1_i10.p1  ORF type:complete len:136 (-),score=21.16 TRINITY_DN12560_c0_g1_i10:85-453(-)